MLGAELLAGGLEDLRVLAFQTTGRALRPTFAFWSQTWRRTLPMCERIQTHSTWKRQCWVDGSGNRVEWREYGRLD